MTATEIEKASCAWADSFDSNIPEFGRIKRDVALMSFREGVRFFNEKQPYTKEDMQKPIDLLKKVREIFLFGVSSDGEPDAPLNDIIEMWGKINDEIKKWEGQKNG